MTFRSLGRVLSVRRLKRAFPLVLTACGVSGFLLMPHVGLGSGYAVILQAHMTAGFLLLANFLCLAVRRFKDTLGTRYVLLKAPVLVLLVSSSLLPLTGEMILVWTSLVLFCDWLFTRRRLRKLGAQGEEYKALRSEYLDFAMVMQCLLSGLFLWIACLSFLLVYHKIHSLSLPLLIVWLGRRPFFQWARPARTVASVSLVLFLGAFAAFFYTKQIQRNDETDVETYPDVHRAVESMSERDRLKPMEAVSLSDSSSCAGKGCHNTIVNQWRGSSHRYAVNNAFFRKEVALYVETEGPEHVRICINCHDPVAAMSPDAEAKYAAGEIENPEGISCKACHVITDYNAHRGNGLYTLKAPFEYPHYGAPEGSKERARHDRLIHADPRRHLRNYRRKEFYRSGEYCITCHLVTVPAQVTGTKDIRLHNLFKQWETSKWRDYLNCVDCHLPRFQMDENGYIFFDHRILGINTGLLLNSPVSEGDRPFVEDFNYFTERYVKGDFLYNQYQVLADPSTYLFQKNPMKRINPFTLYTPFEMKRFFSAMYFLSGGPILDMEANIAGETTADGRLKLEVSTTNARAGHNFPAGPIDVQQIWLQAVLSDAGGKTLSSVGDLDERHYVDPKAPIIGSRGITNDQGQPLVHHEFWKTAGVVDERILAAHGKIDDEVFLNLPEKPRGEFLLKVRWNFRRMNQRICDWVWPSEGKTMPIIVLDYSTFRLHFSDAGGGRTRVTADLIERPGRKSFEDLSRMASVSASEWLDSLSR